MQHFWLEGERAGLLWKRRDGEGRTHKFPQIRRTPAQWADHMGRSREQGTPHSEAMGGDGRLRSSYSTWGQPLKELPVLHQTWEIAMLWNEKNVSISTLLLVVTRQGLLRTGRQHDTEVLNLSIRLLTNHTNWYPFPSAHPFKTC